MGYSLSLTDLAEGNTNLVQATCLLLALNDACTWSPPCFLSLIWAPPGLLSLSCWCQAERFLIWVDRQQQSLLPCACVFQWGSKIGQQIYNNTWMHWIRKDSFRAMTSFYFPLWCTLHRDMSPMCLGALCALKAHPPLSCVCCCCSFCFFLFCLSCESGIYFWGIFSEDGCKQ